MLDHDTVRRAVRTFAQALLGALVIALPASASDALALDLRLLAATVLYAGVVALVTFLHGELEDAGRIRDTRHPAPRPPRHQEPHR